MHLVTLIHGIRTGLTSRSWPQHLAAYLAPMPGVSTEAVYYEAGPLPVWNTVFKNPKLARALAGRILTRRDYDPTLRHSIVAHSNGTHIATLLMKELAADGLRTDTAILTGAAIHSEPEKNGLADLVRSNHLGRAIAYSSDGDGVVRHLQKIPGFYGSLGARGFERAGDRCGLWIEGWQPLAARDVFPDGRFRIVTRWFPGFSHGQYFDPAQRRVSMPTIAMDLGLDLASLPDRATD